ncbi:MAG: phosphate ABC transporter permease subunit PstC [Candidatus Dormiibacterota bacterium]
MAASITGDERSARAAARERRLLKANVHWGDRALRVFCTAAAFVPLLFLFVLAAVLIVNAWPAIIFNGLGFFTGKIWTLGNFYGGSYEYHHGIKAPHNAQYGAATLIVGTLATSAIAMVVAVPVAVGGVLMLIERIPQRLQGLLSVFMELLAGIPSVVYGLWGLIIFGPLIAKHVYPILAHLLGWTKVFQGPVGSGPGLLTAGLALALMVIPIVAATTRDLVRTVPVLHKEGALALGMTRYEMTRIVTIPFVRNGIFAASLLGWGRALGETMAVLMISGDALNIFPNNIYAPVSTIAATIAAMLDSALTDATGMAVRSLAEAGLLLLAITLITNWLGRFIVRRTSGAALPVGRGF